MNVRTVHVLEKEKKKFLIKKTNIMPARHLKVDRASLILVTYSSLPPHV